MVTTPNLGLIKPIVGADDDAWGDMLNANSDLLDSQVVRKTGDTMTGSLTVSPWITVNAADTATSSWAGMEFNTNGGAQIFGSKLSSGLGWSINLLDPSNFTDFSISRYDSSSALIDKPITISQATGVAAFTSTPTAPTAATGDNSTKLATTAFVKAQGYGTGSGASVTISDTPPPGPAAGALWWESDTGQTYIYYNDGNTSQWVALVAAPVISAQNGTGAILGTTGATGVVFTGLTITPTAGFASLYLNKPISGSTSAIYGQKAGSNRWSMEFGNSFTENGSNAGSNFSLSSYTDAGAFLGYPIEVRRASGYTFLNGNGATSTSATFDTAPYGNTALRLNKAGSGKGNYIDGMNNGLPRWSMSLGNSIAETGGGGSDFTISSFNDAGAPLDTPLTISRLNGIATFSNNIYTTGLNIPNGTVVGPTYIEVGSTTSVLPALIDFHSSGAGPDFDCRLISQGGGGGDGLGTLTAYASGGFVCATGVIDPVQGIACRAGQGGALGGYNFSQNWVNPGQMDIWVGTVRVGYMQTVSDYRTKKDIAPLASTWDRVLALNPISYTRQEFQPPGVKANAEGETPPPLFTSDDTPRWGFVAHELQEALIDDAATGVKDGEDVQSPNPWTVIAALTKALQEAMARIEALEAR